MQSVSGQSLSRRVRPGDLRDMHLWHNEVLVVWRNLTLESANLPHTTHLLSDNRQIPAAPTYSTADDVDEGRFLTSDN